MTQGPAWRRRGRTALAGAVVLVIAGVTSCGVDAEEDGTEDSSLRIATTQPIEGLNMSGIDGASRVAITAAKHVFDTLVVKEGDEFTPSLATSWTQPDDLTWVFELRDDALFHDGSPVTAEDVKVSLDQNFEQNGRLVQIWDGFESIEATGEHQVTIHTSRPMGTLLTNLTLLFVMPARFGDDPDLYNREPTGSGPYQVVEFIPSEVLRLTVNEDYWGEIPDMEDLEFAWIPEASSIVTGLSTGEIDFTWELDPDQLATIRGSEDLTVEALPSYIYYMDVINHLKEPFDDVRVRQAMWHAVDSEALVADLFADTGAKVATAPIPSTVFGFKEADIPQYDPALARALLADAGYSDGFSAVLDFEREGGPQQRAIADTLISSWAEVGITIQPNEVERAVWLDRLLNREYDITQQTNPVLTGDADYTIGRLYGCEATFTYCNPQLDEILTQARESFDQEEREALYGQAIDILVEDAVNIFTIELPVNYVMRSNITGFEPTPSGTPLFTSITLG